MDVDSKPAVDEGVDSQITPTELELTPPKIPVVEVVDSQDTQAPSGHDSVVKPVASKPDVMCDNTGENLEAVQAKIALLKPLGLS